MALGVMLGNTLNMTLCFAGLGTLLVASAQALLILKWLGAAYLVFLGIKLWLIAPKIDASQETGIDGRSVFSHAFFLMVLNPNPLTFYIALAPQFIDPTAALVPQLATMELTFVLLSGVNVFFYAFAAGILRKRIRSRSALTRINRTAAIGLISLSFFSVLFVRT